SPSGLYTAPATLAAATNVTVTATSAANPNMTGSSIVSLNPAQVTAFVPIRVNAGGPAVTDAQGLFWSASNGFTGNFGQFSFTPAAGSNLPAVYQTGLNSGGTFQYQASVPNGQYLVTLKFDDSIWTANNDLFEVSINGQSALQHFSPYALVGQNNPYDATF